MAGQKQSHVRLYSPHVFLFLTIHRRYSVCQELVDRDYHQSWRHRNVSVQWVQPILGGLLTQTISPYHFISQSSQKNWNVSNIYQWSTAIPSDAALQSIRLPSQASSNRFHLFALSLTPSVPLSEQPALSIRSTRFTSRWEEIGDIRAQAVEVTLANLAPASSFTSASLKSPITVEIVGFGLSTVKAGVINRLVASDQVRVDVLVHGAAGSSGDATVRIKSDDGSVLSESEGWPVTPLRQKWTPDAESLSYHETPTWVCAAFFHLPSPRIDNFFCSGI